MNLRFRYCLFTLIASFFCHTAIASHLAGSDFTYVYLGDSTSGSNTYYHYRVTLSIYDDCLNGNPDAIINDNPAYIGVFTDTGDSVETDTNIYYSSKETLPTIFAGACYSAGLPFCMLRYVFTKDYYLPPSATGYNIVYQRCCLNFVTNIQTGEDASMSAMCTIPPTPTTNNSAVFINYPPMLIQANTPILVNCSASDPDGDSLTYEFCTAYNDTGLNLLITPKPIPAPPPYPPYAYISPLSYTNPMTCSVPLSINSATGILTGTPDSTGTYLISICCHEWRAGAMINTVQRVFEFVVDQCWPAGIPNISNDNTLQLYPNPATSQLTIQSTNNLINKITITNLLGQSLLPIAIGTAVSAGQHTVTLDVSALPSGIYFIKINDAIMQKFVKS